MPFAEVCVNSPAGRQQLFSYAIPPGLDVLPGHAVWAPFGAQPVQGIVIELSSVPSVESVRPLYGLIEPEPLLSPAALELAKWISGYYLSPLFDALALFLPPGFERRASPCLSLAEGAPSVDINSLSEEGRRLASLLQGKNSLKMKDVPPEVAAELVGCGRAVRGFATPPPRVRPKTEALVRLAVSRNEAAAAVTALQGRRSLKQAALASYMLSWPDGVTVAELRLAGFGRPVINALAAAGLIALEERQVKRQAIDYSQIIPSSPLEPTPAQLKAIQAINTEKPGVFLLRGVTGSGKTEVYLQALAHTIAQGRQGLVLVPEIALTPQTVERFAARFPHRVAVLHSRLSLGEQYDAWRDIKAGLYDVVVGARGALFAPLERLGLIVMDEEHEWTYKQVDQSPRYHARDAAVKLAELSGASLVLGSATPDVESYYKAVSGEYRLLELPERLTPHPGAPMPDVTIVDLRAELKSGNRSIFSRELTGPCAGRLTAASRSFCSSTAAAARPWCSAAAAAMWPSARAAMWRSAITAPRTRWCATSATSGANRRRPARPAAASASATWGWALRR